MGARICYGCAGDPGGGFSSDAYASIKGLALALFCIGAVNGAEPAQEVSVHRTMMPESGPSTFAVGFGETIGFSYDPGRGGVNFIWEGEFVDLEPTWRAKINNPAIVRGKVVYRESARWPLRLNDPDHEPRFKFRGYRLFADAVEFHYLLDETFVRERIQAAPDGRGIVREFIFESPPERWWYLVDSPPGVGLSVSEGRWEAGQRALTGSGATGFSMFIELSGGGR